MLGVSSARDNGGPSITPHAPCWHELEETKGAVQVPPVGFGKCSDWVRRDQFKGAVTG